MSLSERLAAPPTKQRYCSFYKWKMTLSPEDRATVDRCTADKSYPIGVLVAEFAKDGCPVKETRLSYHRSGRCTVCGNS